MLFACNDEDNIYDQQREKIFGNWEIVQASQEIRSDTVYRESASRLYAEFYSDGTGKQRSAFTQEEFVDFEWYFQYNPETVLIIYNTQFFQPNLTEFEVLKNEEDRQIWDWEVDPMGGEVDIYLHTWKMDRVE